LSEYLRIIINCS